MVDRFVNEYKFKPVVISSLMLFALVIMGTSTVIGRLYIPEWYELFVGIILMLIAIPVHLLAKKRSWLYFVSFFINSIGSGLSIAAYYSKTGKDVDIVTISVTIFSVILLFFFLSFISSRFINKGKRFFIAENIFWSILLFTNFILWIDKGLILFSFGFFAVAIVWVYRVVEESESRAKCLAACNLSFGSFGGFIIVTLIVISILSEGDVLDVGTFDGSSNPNKKNEKQPEEQPNNLDAEHLYSLETNR
jgi:hypothetical protein